MGGAFTVRSRVRRLAIREPRTMESPRARRIIEQSIGGADLEPAGFGPAELVVVRSVTLRVRGAAGAEGRELGQSLRGRVAELARGAVRPERGILPAGAAAVRFSSLAEALATFALSASEGRAAREWWWRSLFGKVLDDWSELWCRHAEEHPAALEHLAASGRLGGVARQISPPVGERLLAAVVRAFGLTRIAGALQATRPPTARHVAAPGSGAAAAGDRPEATVTPAEAARELSRYAPLATADSVPGAVRGWIAVASVVAGAPRVARGPGFARMVAALAGHSAPVVAVPTTRVVVSGPPATGEESDADDERPVRAPGPQGVTDEARLPSASTPVDARPGDAATFVGIPQARPLERDAPDAPAQPEAPAFDVPEEVVRTAFGGALYLVNVAIALGLYADFTEPLKPGLDLPLWDFVAAAARGLSTDPRAFETDPLWAWLARMAGRRPDEPPGTGAAAPPDSGSWLEWIDVALPGVERRLSRALGAQPGRFIRQTGALVHSGATVRVHFALALHPLEIRLAGLDRDPGFIPAAGVDVRFVYE